LEINPLLKLVKAAPLLLLALLSAAALVALWKPSAIPDLFGFSIYRFVGLCAVGIALMYFTASLLLPRLQSINNFGCYTVVVVGIMIEGPLRLFTPLIPDNLLTLLPHSARQEIAAERGYFNPMNVVGEGLY
jgi:hypothetical protein